MHVEPIITYLNVEPSAALDAKVRERIAHLDRMFPNLNSCRVAISRDDSHHHQGRHYRVRIDVTAPGHELVADRAPPQHQAHEDPFVALRDAFDAIERRVQDLAREMRGDVKTHVAPAHGRIVEIDHAAGRGRIVAADGRSLYFHRNAVVGARFDELEAEREVRFEEHAGDDGPQAVGVAPVGHHHVGDPLHDLPGSPAAGAD